MPRYVADTFCNSSVTSDDCPSPDCAASSSKARIGEMDLRAGKPEIILELRHHGRDFYSFCLSHGTDRRPRSGKTFAQGPACLHSKLFAGAVSATATEKIPGARGVKYALRIG